MVLQLASADCIPSQIIGWIVGYIHDDFSYAGYGVGIAQLICLVVRHRCLPAPARATGLLHYRSASLLRAVLIVLPPLRLGQVVIPDWWFYGRLENLPWVPKEKAGGTDE